MAKHWLRALLMSFKKTVFLTHRWLGVLLSVLFVVWFISGLVMVYVPYPRTDAEARIAGQPVLDSTTCCAESLPALEPDERLRLRMLDEHLLVDAGGAWRYAQSGERLTSLDVSASRRITRDWLGGADDTAIASVRTLHNDQWTVSGRYRAHRPLHRVELEDGRWLHVSSQSGEMLLTTTRGERAWNWLGTVSHWLYFTALREHAAFWRQVVIWLSVAGCLLAAAGLWGGFKQLRWRRRRRGKSVIPYRGVAFWHHATGAIFGVLVFTFILSGLFSMNPWGIFSAAREAPSGEHAALHASATPLSPARIAGAWQRFDAAEPDFGARELSVFAFDGQWWLRFRNRNGASMLQALHGGPPRTALPETAMQAAADRLAAGAPERDRMWRNAPDTYYYDRHGRKPFPVLRLRLSDEAARWYYLDPASGSIAYRSDTTGRAYRWWFNALHSLDFPWLLAHRPAWDGVIILASLGGLLVSATGVVVGLRRTRTALRRR